MESPHDYIIGSAGKRKTVVRMDVDEDDDLVDNETPPTQKLKSRRRTSSHESDLFIRYQEISEDSWSNRYHYVLFCSLLGNGSDVFPTTMALAMTLSGGTFMVILAVNTLLIGLPLVYMETFLGRYTKLTNCQMYRMCPIFFGLSFVIFVCNLFFLPIRAVEDTQILVNLLKLLINPSINDGCLHNTTECYDYLEDGPIENDTCKYGYMSMICEQMGEVRYPMAYQFWKTYRDPDSEMFPHFQIVVTVVLTWFFIIYMVTKGISTLGTVLHISFLVQMTVLSLVFGLSLVNDGSWKGFDYLIKVRIDHIDWYELICSMWFCIYRLGILVPTGYMTYSAYATFGNNVATECALIVTVSTIFTIYYLIVFFVMCGILAHNLGVDVDVVNVPGRGIYLAIIPQIMITLQLPNAVLVIYYGSLWFFETVRIALCAHMMVLNLYDYFPNFNVVTLYIWVGSCLVLMGLSIPVCTRYAASVWMPTMGVMLITKGLGLLLTLQVIMICYFYGAGRLCNDIHFVSGEKPMSFWKIMWIIMPILCFTAIAIMFLKEHKTIIEKNLVSHQEMKDAEKFGGWIIIAFAVLSIVASAIFVFLKIGTPQMCRHLFKPQFYWGSIDKKPRTERKEFSPGTAIRSQRNLVTVEKTEGSRFSSSLVHCVREVLTKHYKDKEALCDKNFFDGIGIFRHGGGVIIQDSDIPVL